MKQEYTDISDEFTWQPYRMRPLAVWAMRMNQEFHCTSLNGTLTGKAGDWIVRADDGWTYPVAEDIFRRYYVKREWRKPNESKSQETHNEGHEENGDQAHEQNIARHE